MTKSSDWPVSRLVKMIIVIGLLSQYSFAGFFGLDPIEDPQAPTENIDDGALNLQEILSLLWSPIVSNANAQDDELYTYVNSRIRFASEGSVTGKGFTNVRNRMEDAGNDSLSRSLHGSGSYSSENVAGYYSIIESEMPAEIVDEFGDAGDTLFNGTFDSQFSALKTSNLSATYFATPFYLYGPTYLNFSSRWSEITKAKSYQDEVSFLESYRYTTTMNKSSDLTIDAYSVDSLLESNFQGMAVIQYSSPENCFKDSYIGNYNLDQDISSDSLTYSSTGIGFANIDRKIKIDGLQRTYAQGSGDLVLDERIGKDSNSIEKSISLTFKPIEFAPNPGNSLNLSSKWSEGVSSKTDGRILLSESFTDIEVMDKETKVVNPTSIETLANYTGRGEFVIAGENYTTDEVYIGNYSIARRVEIVQLPRYNRPHITVIKQLYIDPANCKVADYNITATNDGNTAFEPVFIRDTFPTGTSFLGSSEPPIELTSRIANWSIEDLSPGESKSIRLRLKIEREVEKLTNRVRATAYYLDTSNKVSRTTSNYNSTVLLDKDICMQGKLSVATTSTLDKKGTTIRFRSTVENLAEYNVSVNLTSYLPEGASFLNSTPRTITMGDDYVTWSFKLNTGKKRTITYYVQYNGSGLIESRAVAHAVSAEGHANLTAETIASVLIPESKTIYVDRIYGDWLAEDLADPLLPVCGSDAGQCLLSPSEDIILYRAPIRTVSPSPGYSSELSCC